MSFRNLKSEIHTARKNYRCDACNWLEIEELRRNFHLTISEWRSIIKARNNGYKILKGEKYEYNVNIQDGDFQVFRCIPEINDICLKYELYPED
jgi:hypothetical protein